MIWIGLTAVIILFTSVAIIKALKLYRKQPMTYNQLQRKGLALELIGMKKEAVQTYKRGLQIIALNEEERKDIHYLIGLILQNSNNSAEAVQHFNEVFTFEQEKLPFRKEYQQVIDAYKVAGQKDLTTVTEYFSDLVEYDRRFKTLDLKLEETY